MRSRLAETLEYVFNKVGDDLGVPIDKARIVAEQIKSGPQSPHIFGAYYDLVFALENEELERARLMAEEILGRSASAPLTIGPIDDRPSADEDRYRRLLMTGMDYAVSPDSALMADYRQRLAAAFELLDEGFPQMAAEIRALLREIVVAAGPEDPKALTFDGASSYMMWGAVLLNARGQNNVLDTAQALAHESGHNLLFGFSSSGPLVENSDDELFSSPLRRDPRPMDGVFHATYVIARMHQTLNRLLESAVLDADQAELAKRDLALHRKNFEAGDLVIHEGGRLTEIGRQAIKSAREYMAAAS